MKLYKLLATGLIGLSLVAVAGSSFAQSFPRRSVEMVVPFGAGGASDIFARQFSEIASKYLGQPITVVNKSGAGTIIGMTYAYSAPADGYTILEVTPSLPIVEARNGSSIKFRSAFEPLMRIQTDVQLFGVPKNSPFKTMDELIAYAKANPNKIRVGGISPGGLDDYTAHGFAKAAGFTWNYVPYKNSSVLKAAVLGGELDVYQDKTISFMSLVSSGDIRPLMVLSDKHSEIPELKDVPCSVEKGIQFTQGSWRGFVVKKGTPENVKQILVSAFKKAYDDPAYKKIEKQQMIDKLPGYLNAEDFRKSIDEQVESFSKVFKDLGLVNE